MYIRFMPEELLKCLLIPSDSKTGEKLLLLSLLKDKKQIDLMLMMECLEVVLLRITIFSLVKQRKISLTQLEKKFIFNINDHSPRLRKYRF